MQAYQQEFIDFLIETGALRFGEFTLKSGRRAPYFFNAGQFNTGAEIERLGYFYACAIRELDVEPTLVFGPAYKGIPLCIAAAIALRQRFDMDTSYGFDRKEIKEHGEGGWLVGKEPDPQDRVVLVDDVVTDGATKIQMIRRLKAACSARISGLVIALDRKERNADGEDAVAALQTAAGVTVRSIITIQDVLEYLPGRSIDGKIALTPDFRGRIESYLDEHGRSA
ncbi:MAG: orotate phosphoribosyltransferase [Gemmatimonadota bacterium]|nr:orotate phosphoribosyltransferase [Gemmatimonadota bacterium]